MTFRPREDQTDFLDEMKERDVPRTDVLITALDMLMAADRQLGKELKLLEAYAEMSGTTLADAFARAAKLGLPALMEQLKKTE